MAKRKGLSKKIRFEVFKRDSFTCQYCGRKAPDVILEVDHIEPVSKGGSDDLLNLVTSCKECNVGKGDRRISDASVVDVKRRQLEELQERKEQLEMMFEWQQALLDLDEQAVEHLSLFWTKLTRGYSLNENGASTLRQTLKRYRADEIMAAMKIAAEVYFRYDGDIPTHESVEVAWSKVAGICRTSRIEQEKPYIRRLYYIRGILRNRFNYVNESDALWYMERAAQLGASLDTIEQIAKECTNWTQWRREMEDYIDQLERGE